MTCTQCTGVERMFDDTVARRELKKYRKKGPSKGTRLLIEALGAGRSLEGLTFLDVGGGVGAIPHALLDAGAAGGTHADASPAYLAVARDEAERRGHAQRIRHVEGDFVELAPSLDEADLVTLDRVICCYHDMPALVDASASKARRVVGLVYPRERLAVRIGCRLTNLVQRLRRHPFRVFVHATADVEARLASHGFERASLAHTFLWQISTFTRSAADAGGGD